MKEKKEASINKSSENVPLNERAKVSAITKILKYYAEHCVAQRARCRELAIILCLMFAFRHRLRI